MIDAHADAFPKSRVFLNIGGPDNLSINDYAAIRGLHFRQDGLKPDGASYNCGEWLYKPYSRRGVICNYEFYDGYEEMRKKGWGVPATITKALEAPVSYLNSNLFAGEGFHKAAEEGRQELTRAARKLGYRFEAVKIRYPREFGLWEKLTTRIPVTSWWRNDGVAPCYGSYALRWSLVAADGRVVSSELVFPQKPTTQWWPGEEVQVDAVLRIPPGTAAGQYTLQVAMVDPGSTRPIQLGLAGVTATGDYPLATLTGAARATAPVLVCYEEGFEGESKAGHPSKGITLAVKSDKAHSGARALSVEGTTQKAWNYMSFRLPTLAPPGSKIRFSGWMLAEQLSSAKIAPYFKIGVNDRAGHWLVNLQTAAYDLTKLGTWQKLEGIGELPMNAGSGDFAIERGALEAELTVKFWIDDLKIELMESF